MIGALSFVAPCRPSSICIGKRLLLVTFCSRVEKGASSIHGLFALDEFGEGPCRVRGYRPAVAAPTSR